MTGPQPSSRRVGRSQGGRNGGRNGAMQQQLSQIVTDLKTAVDLMAQTSEATRSAASDMTQMLRDNRSQMSEMINMLSTGGGPSQFGSVRIGGRMTAGPLFGRDYLNQPSAGGWPSGRYPGGTSYGMGAQGMPGVGMPQAGTMGALRQTAANAIHQRFGMGQYSSEHVGNDPTTGEPRFQLRNSAGVPQGEAGTRSELMQTFGAARLASQVAGGLGGGGIMGASRAIPGIGAAVMAAGAVYKGAEFIGNQRAANAGYQSIYGGSNMAGMGQRFSQEGYTLGQLFSGGLPTGQARQAFQQVSAMGYQGNQRQDRLNFVSSNYKSMGMNAQDSLQIVALASQTLTSSLSDLHDQLKAVTVAAKQTGQSAQVMRQSFTNNLTAATQAGAGVGSGVTAQAMTAATVGMGRGTATLGYGGMINSAARFDVTAANAGYASGGALLQAMQKDPTALAGAMDKNIQQSLMSQIPGVAMQTITEGIRAAGGADAILGYGGDSIAQRIGISVANYIDPAQIDPINQAFGIDTTAMTIPQKYGALVKEIAKQQGGGLKREAQKAEDKRATQYTGAAAQKQFQAAGGVVGSNSDTGSLAGVYTPTTDAQRKANPTAAGFTTTKWDTVIQKMEKDIGKNGLVRVKTAGGFEVVTLAEASSHFRDQLTNGTAELVSGENPGSTVGDIYGTEANTGYKDSTKTKAGSVPSALGSSKQAKAIMSMPNLSAADLNKIAKTEHDKGDVAALAQAKKLSKDDGSDKKVKGSISLYMKPELARWLGVDTTGDVTNQTAVDGAPSSQSPYGSTVK